MRRAAPAAAAASLSLAASARAAAAAARAEGRLAESDALVALGHSAAAIAELLGTGDLHAQVDARLRAVQPCLEAQVAAAERGGAAGTARGLVGRDDLAMRNGALHVFDLGDEPDFAKATPARDGSNGADASGGPLPAAPAVMILRAVLRARRTSRASRRPLQKGARAVKEAATSVVCPRGGRCLPQEARRWPCPLRRPRR